MTESQREERRQKRAQATGKPVGRRLALVPRGSKKSTNRLGLTDVQAKVVDALMRLGNQNVVASELGMTRKAVSQRICMACKRTNSENSVLLVLAWARAKWEAEHIAPMWKALAA